MNDTSFDPEQCQSTRCVWPEGLRAAPICLPPITDFTPRITRRFSIERQRSMAINGRLMDCKVPISSSEEHHGAMDSPQQLGWLATPCPIHLEELRAVSRNGKPVECNSGEFGRKDVVELGFDTEIELLMQFRDFRGGYVMHCHNTVHEDHQMMLLFNVADIGDNLTQP